MSKNMINILGTVALGASMIITGFANWVSNKRMESTIKEEVEKALAERTENEEDEDESES